MLKKRRHKLYGAVVVSMVLFFIENHDFVIAQRSLIHKINLSPASYGLIGFIEFLLHPARFLVGKIQGEWYRRLDYQSIILNENDG